VGLKWARPTVVVQLGAKVQYQVRTNKVSPSPLPSSSNSFDPLVVNVQRRKFGNPANSLEHVQR